MVDLMHCQTNSLFFGIPLLYYYTSICCLFPGDMNLSFSTSDSSLGLLFCGFLDFLETLVIFSAILFPIKSPVTSAVFEEVFIASVIDFLHYQEVFDHIYCLIVYKFFARDKNPFPFTSILSLGSIEYLIFIMTVLFNYLC